MDLSEIKGLIWESLAKAPGPHSPEQVAKDTGLGLPDVVRAMAGLRQVRLVEVSNPLPKPTYQACRELDALRWAIALEEGVPLSVLEKHATLALSGRQEALRLASSGMVDQVKADGRAARKQAREDTLRGRAATKAAATDVARIAEDTKTMLERVEKERPDVPPEVLSILRRAHEQAAKAVEQLARSLG